MTRQSRIANRKAWADRLDRFKQADQTVAQFCTAEGVSVPSFYKWRSKLAPKPEASHQAAPKFLPVQIPASEAANPADSPAAVLSVDLPGGVTVRLEVQPVASVSS